MRRDAGALPLRLPAHCILGLVALVGMEACGRSTPRAGPDDSAAVARSGPASQVQEDSAVDGPATRAELLRLWARSYFPGRSGDLMFVPRPGVTVTDRDPNYPFMHGGPWDDDARIPMLLMGGPWIRPGVHPGLVSHQDLGVTLAELVGLPPASGADGRVLREALAEGTSDGPRVLALLVLDGLRPDYLEWYADSLPTLRALVGQAAVFPDARVDYLPTATAVTHSTLSTGSRPRLHGIVANRLVAAGSRDARSAFEGGSPRHLLAPTLADRWSAVTRGRAVIAVQGGTDYPAAALAGHGACLIGGRRFHVAFFRPATGGWATRVECYRLPPALLDLTVDALWPDGLDGWMGHPVPDARELRRTAHFVRLEGEAAVRTLRSLPFGADGVTDLFWANLKTLDYVGHRYGPESPEIESALAAVDREVGRIVDALDGAAGPDGWVLAVTSDHGMPGEPPPGRRRHYVEEIASDLDRQFDPSGPGVVRYLGTASLQIYLDLERLSELGVTVEAVARYLERQPWVTAAFPAAEVLEATRLLAAPARGSGR